ncbi:MAG: hypothetical protein KatS3mg005_2062 [Bryobacteraceae bacterium]|nr:MAG: hypothetical protein KatS3mg005_2062 [Bryobacteraceae bacterium]
MSCSGVFQRPANSKLPAGKWKRQALSRNEALAGGGNIGLRTGRGLLVVDLDRKNGYDGMAQWQDLCRQHGYDSPAPLVQTPTGGWHIYFSAPSSRRLAGHVGVLPGVDLRGDGNYVLVPASRTDAGEYRYVDPDRTEAGPHPPAPKWLLDLAQPDKPKGPGPRKGKALDLPADPEPATDEEVEAALQALQARWPEMPWRAIWAGEEMTRDRHGAVRTPSQRDQMVAYRLAAIGYAPEAIVRLMTACPAVRARRAGKQPDAWRRASYRQATIQAAVELVQQHRACRTPAPAAEADDAIGQALEKLRKMPGWGIWAAQAQIVRRRAARDGQPSTRITRRIMLDRLRAAGIEVSERQYRQVWDARRNPLLEASEDASGYWWFRLAETAIREAAERTETQDQTPAAPASASGRSGGRAGDPDDNKHRRVYSRDHSPKSVPPSPLSHRILELSEEGKSVPEICRLLDAKRNTVKVVLRRWRRRHQAAEAAPEAAQPEAQAGAVDVYWTLTPARRVLCSCYIRAGALADSRRREAWVRAANRIDAYAQAVRAPQDWDRLPDFRPSAAVRIGPQEAAQEVIRIIAAWLRYTPPADWLPDHQQAIRAWIANEERRMQAVLDRMARKAGARRYRARISDALLLEKAFEALNLRRPWLPGVWISRRDYRKTTDDFQAFREGWAMARTDHGADIPAAEDVEATAEEQSQPEVPERRRRWSEFIKSQTVPRNPEVIFVTDEQMASVEPPEVQPPGVLYIVVSRDQISDFEEEECHPAK